VRDTEMAAALRACGYRLTPQRLAVIQVLREATEHLTPSQVLERTQSIRSAVGLTTVYRTLDLLEELGFVRRLHAGGGCQAYATVRERAGHHLVCRRCHQVVDFPCQGLTGLIEQTAQRTGFAVASHLLELEGLCPACQSCR
jgi:Fe2+ or Zn2+ uptake regulation protein